MHLKSLFTVVLGTVLLTSTGQALADRDDRRGYRGGHHYDKVGHSSRRHYSSHRYGNRKWHNPHRRDWRHRRGNSVRIYHHYRHRPDFTGFIGGALLGSAITHSLHGSRDYDHSYDRRGQITGCYRIERLGDGRERRVELPLSWCR